MWFSLNTANENNFDISMSELKVIIVAFDEYLLKSTTIFLQQSLFLKVSTSSCQVPDILVAMYR